MCTGATKSNNANEEAHLTCKAIDPKTGGICGKELKGDPTSDYVSWVVKMGYGTPFDGDTIHVLLCVQCFADKILKVLAHSTIDSYIVNTNVAAAQAYQDEVYAEIAKEVIEEKGDQLDPVYKEKLLRTLQAGTR